MARITWNEALPSDDSRTDPRELQDIWHAVRIGLQESTTFPDQARPKGGTFKFARGDDSKASWTGRHRGYWASDVSRLFIYDTHGDQSASASSITCLGGTYGFMEHATTSPGEWVVVSGETFIDPAATNRTVRYSLDGLAPNLVYYENAPVEADGNTAAWPRVQVTSENTNYLVTTSYVTAGGFELTFYKFQGNVSSGFTVHFTSSGTTTGGV